MSMFEPLPNKDISGVLYVFTDGVDETPETFFMDIKKKRLAEFKKKYPEGIELEVLDMLMVEHDNSED